MADTCPEATWQKLPFIPSDTTPGFNPVDWTQEQFVGYGKGPILSATAVNLAFLGIVLLLLALFLFWRLIRCLGWCCSVCCGHSGMRRRKSLLTYEVMHDLWMKAYKVMFVFFAVGCIALAATGMATLPRAAKLTDDLEGRLTSASAFVSSLLTASDGLLGGAAELRPLMSQTTAFVQSDLSLQTMAVDAQCTSAMLDATLAPPSNPAALRAQMLAADVALRTAVSPALTAAAALLSATAGPGATAATPALVAVAAAPSLLSEVSDGLASYDNALAALPSARQPTSTSNPKVSDLQAAQTALRLSGWISRLDTLYDSLRVTAAAARQLPYTRLAAALTALRAASNATSVTQLQPLATALGRLDSLYLATSQQQQQQQQQGVVPAGRACIARLTIQLARFDDTVFSFNNGTLEAGAMAAVPGVQASLEGLYGNANASAVVAGAASGEPAATSPLAALQLLSPLVAADDASLASQCAAVQAALSDVAANTSRLPDEMPTLSYLASLRAALAALQSPAGQVAAALATYGSSPSDATYNTLYSTSNATRRGAVANARATAGAAAPSGYNAIVSAASNAAVNADGALQTSLLALSNSTAAALSWLATADPGSARLAGSAAALRRLQSIFDANAARLATAKWNATTAATPSAAANTTAPSTFLQPLQQSIGLIATTLSNGLSAIAEQLDNALGKALPSPSPRPSISPSPSASPATTNGRRALQQTTTFLNATSKVQQQLVARIDKLAVSLNNSQSEQYTAGAYFGPIAIYAAVIATTLLLGLAAFLNWPGGLVVLFVLHLITSALVLAGAWAAAAALVVGHDSCASADGIVLAAVSPSSPLFPLVRYYLQGVGGTLPAVLRASGLGDTARLAAAADALHGQVLNPLLLPAPPGEDANVTANATADMPAWPGSLGTVQYGLGGILADLSATSAVMSGHLTVLLTLGDRPSVLGQYGAVTSWACCDLGGELFLAWVCATGCGVLAFTAAFLALLILKNLDDMPGGGGGGGCSCYRARDFPLPKRGRRGGAASSGGGGADPELAKGRGFGSSGGGSYGQQPSATATIAAPAAANNWATGKPKEVVVESGLFQGPAAATAAVASKPSSASPAALREAPPPPPVVPPPPPQGAVVTGASTPTAGHRPSITMCVMDQATAAAFGYGGEDAASAPPQMATSRRGDGNV